MEEPEHNCACVNVPGPMSLMWNVSACARSEAAEAPGAGGGPLVAQRIRLGL